MLRVSLGLTKKVVGYHELAGTLKCGGWAGGEIRVKNLRGQEHQPLFSLRVLQMSVLMLQVQGVVKTMRPRKARWPSWLASTCTWASAAAWR